MKRSVATLLGLVALAAASPLLAQNSFAPGMRSVKIAVNDFAKSTAFYAALGMKPGPDHGSTRELVWEGSTQNSGIVMASPDYAKTAKMQRGGTYFMIMTPDVKAVADKLRAQNYPGVGEPRQMGTMATYMILTDPDGNQIELLGPAAKK